MATRAKPKEIVAESQKVFGFVMKAHKWIAIPLAVITVVVVTIWSISDLRHGIWGESSSSQQEKTLTMSPGGNSERIPGLSGHRVLVDGKKGSFLVHSVYEDGHECAFGETCIDGTVVAIYVTNKDVKNPNIVTWSYTSIKK